MIDVDANRKVRAGLLIREALQVLDEAGEPLPLAELLARVQPRVAFTDYELAPAGRGSEARWRVHLSWFGVDLKAAGWVVGSGQGWAITDVGRDILAQHGDAPGGLAIMAHKVYVEKHPTRTKAGHYAPILDAALDLVGPGWWTSYSDLAALAATNAQTVGSYMGISGAEGAHRVLQKNGTVSPGFSWADGRTDDIHEVLKGEGLRFGPDARADEAQHMRAGDLREHLEDVGVLVPAPKRAWFVRTPPTRHDLPQRWYDEGFVSLPAAQLPEVDPGIGRDDLRVVIAQAYSQSPYSTRAQRLDDFHAFLTRMQSDDKVVSSDGEVLRIGTVTGAPDQQVEGESGDLVRDVEWEETSHPVSGLPARITSRLQVQSDVVEMTQQLKLLDELSGDTGGESGVISSIIPAATDRLAAALTLPKEWLQECLDLLADRPQLILYGPPGTGKTYVAQALARHIARDNVRLVQFHPSYSYEDFFEGYRPVPSGGFELKPGPFRKTVDAARENPDVPYVLVIDEINRGNLATVFGELYFLLEYRDQNVDLLYASDDEIGFTLPDNVFIIATMNTADRSIALVDTAMRRRFAFLPLIPGQEPLVDMLRTWLSVHGHDTSVADLLDELNARIADPDFLIGPSYFMRPATHEPGGLERVWRTSILPLLEEHHYGEGVDVEARYGLAAVRAALGSRD